MAREGVSQQARERTRVSEWAKERDNRTSEGIELIDGLNQLDSIAGWIHMLGYPAISAVMTS